MVVSFTNIRQNLSCALALFLLVGTAFTGGLAQNHDNTLLLGRDRQLLPYSAGDGRWGYIDDSGNVIVPAAFGSATFFYGGFGIVKDMDGRCGYIDTNGKLAIPVQFTFCETFSEGIATVQFHNHVGTDMKFYKINAQGKFVFPTELGYVGEFVENIAPARKDTEKCGYIDTSENWGMDPKFDYCSSLSDGLATVGVRQPERKCGYVDRTGKLVIPLKFDRCDSFHEGVAAVAVYVKWNDRVLVGTSLGRFLLRALNPPDDTKFAEPPSWYPRHSWGYINRSGTWTIAPQYQNASSFFEGRAVVGKDSDLGYINSKDEPVLKSRFIHAEGFHDGYAKVAIETPDQGIIRSPAESTERWGVIDATGTFVHSPRFRSIFDFELLDNGTIRIVEDLGGNGWEFPGKRARTTYVSASGKVIWPRPPAKSAKPVHPERPHGNPKVGAQSPHESPNLHPVFLRHRRDDTVQTQVFD